jgi:hypothetical protein
VSVKNGPENAGPFLFLARRRADRLGAPVPMVQLVHADLPAQRIAMNAEQTRCPGLVSIGAIEYALYEFLFELIYSFFKQNASLDHLTH